MSLTSTVDLKVIPLFVNKKWKARVKVHLSQTDYPKVTQVSGMIYTEQAHIDHCPWPALQIVLLFFLVPESTQIYFGAKSFFACVNVISRCVHSSRWFEKCGGNQVQQVHLHRGCLSGEVELNRESAGEFGYDGGGVMWKCDR